MMRDADWTSPCGRYRLWCGDSRELLPQLVTESIDAVVTDPPYGVAFRGKNTKHSSRRNSGYISGDDPEVGPTVVRLCIANEWRSVVSPGIRLMWKYPEPADVGGIYCPSGAGLGKWGFVGIHPVLFYGRCPYLATGRGHRPNVIRSFATQKDNGHPCPKPIEWMEWMVNKASADAGETILDPFVGSGTTGVACVQLGRAFIGIEKQPEYFDLAVNRISEALGMEVPEKCGVTQRKLFASAAAS